MAWETVPEPKTTEYEGFLYDRAYEHNGFVKLHHREGSYDIVDNNPGGCLEDKRTLRALPEKGRGKTGDYVMAVEFVSKDSRWFYVWVTDEDMKIQRRQRNIEYKVVLLLAVVVGSASLVQAIFTILDYFWPR